MKIAIARGKGAFDQRWEAYCQEKGIDYKIVNPYSSNIISEVSDCDAFMWHHHHGNCADPLFAKQLLYSLQTVGKKVFPDWHTTWHFDDKVGQKYLLEAIGAPLVPSYVFYDKKSAMQWVSQTTFPKVFKLRGGAGASNVILVKNRKSAEKLIKKAFGKGFKHNAALNAFKDRVRKWKEGKQSFMIIVKGLIRMVFPARTMIPPDKGYVYFQDFIPNNNFDIRIVVIGDKAFAEKRMVRKGDFRASGGGNNLFDRNEIPEECVKVSFEVAEKLQSQSCYFDYVFGADGKPSVVEVSYCSEVRAYDACPGYWSKNMEWHEGKFNPQAWMVQDLVNQVVDLRQGGRKLSYYKRVISTVPTERYKRIA